MFLIYFLLPLPHFYGIRMQNKIKIKKSDRECAAAQAPVIVSASRATDIPAFFGEWFMNRLKAGYTKWRNPFNGTWLYVSFEMARLFIFWTKNPKPMTQHINYLDEHGLNYYFQFTLNDYDDEKLEPNLPCIEKRIETFCRLSEQIGKEKVIWRYDPLILTSRIGMEELLKKVENVGNQLRNYTKKLVFSFADIKNYIRVQKNLQKNYIAYKEFDERTMNEFADGLRKLNNKWQLELASCCEEISLEKYGINHNKCVDNDLIAKLFHDDRMLLNLLRVDKHYQQEMFDNTDNRSIQRIKLKDKGQRLNCGCIISRDIGEYSTCLHLCEYCYANASKHEVMTNWNLHKQNRNSESITGK
jgi:DNA repair photolyase